jgi:acyl transferase domain-containing protein
VEGFESIVFPAEEAHGLGQQIVAAVSNGWTRQRIVNDVRPPVAEPAGPAAPAPSSPPVPAGQPAAVHARQVITAKLSEALRMDADAIAGDAPFADFGVDSIIGVNLVRTIGEALQIELETTSLFEYSTVDELAQYILKKWPAEIAALVEETPGSAPAGIEPGSEERSIGTTRFAEAGSALDSGEDRRSETSGHEPIAIIGMSGRFAESESLDAFWQHLAQGHDLVKEVSRWSPEDCARTESSRPGACSRGSFIDSIDRFDAAFFGISALEATYMDPQQRLFLEESWSALEDAGYAGAGVHEKQCGVYVGCGAAGYDELVPADAPAQAFWGNSQAVVPARIAYSLNLQGPAIAVDTACSSSLVAIHLACQGLWAGETEMAVAGGVFLQATPGFYQAANRAGMLSPDGKCHSFDARANGFVPGEGVGAVVLKRLRDAVADGDNIHGVIAGSAINQDGRSNGLIAPNGRAQERLERLVYERFKIDPSTIQVVEAHATGTLLGDSVEYAALSRAFGDAAGKGRSCALGTVKTNIGHASTASGIAGVLKILLSLRHRQIPPSLHFEKGNPAIDFGSGPFYVNTELKAWDAGAGGVRRAAVSSFGFSGTNAHLIIEEAPAVVRRTVDAPAYLIVLSARSGGQLKQQVLDLLAHLEGTPGPAMTDVSFSLFAGRMHFAHRLACVARNREELMQLLGQWVESGAAGRVYAAEVQEARVREHAALARLGNRCIHECRNATAAEVLENLTAIADLYVQGYSLDFQALFSGDAKRVPLPTYPFARERYWAGAVSDAAPRSPVARADEPAERRAWLFAKHASVPRIDSMVAVETMTLFLKDEAALQLQKTIEEIPTDRSFFDLGLTSLGMTNLVQNTCRLLDEDLSPSVLFEYRDIESLAAHLATAYPAATGAVTAVRQGEDPRDTGSRLRARAVRPPQAPRPSPVQEEVSGADVSLERILESVSFQEASVHDGYEKVTF